MHIYIRLRIEHAFVLWNFVWWLQLFSRKISHTEKKPSVFAQFVDGHELSKHTKRIQFRTQIEMHLMSFHRKLWFIFQSQKHHQLIE